MTTLPTALQVELKQTRAFRSPAEESIVAVLRTAALMKRAWNRRIEKHGLSLAQYNVLRILRGAGEEGLPTLAVRDRLIEEAPGITRLIDKLERAHLVARERNGKDRRTVRCIITPAGLRLLDVLEPATRGAHALIEEGLPAVADQRRLLELLAAVRAALAAEIPAPQGAPPKAKGRRKR